MKKATIVSIFAAIVTLPCHCSVVAQQTPSTSTQKSRANVPTGGNDSLRFVDGTCSSSSHTSEGAVEEDLTERQSRFFCDSAVIKFFDSSHVMVQFLTKKANHAPTLGFAGKLGDNVFTMPVDHVYLETGKATNVSDGLCIFTLEGSHVKSITCAVKVEEGGRKNVAKVEFNAEPSQ